MISLKKVLSLILCTVMLLFSVACSNNNPINSNSNDESVSSSVDNSTSYSDNDITSSYEQSFFSEDSYIISEESELSSSESSENSSLDYTTEDSIDSIDSVDSFDSSDETNDLGTRFSAVAPTVDFNSVWTSGKMEMFNTDFRMSDELLKKFETKFSSFSNAQSVALIELDTNMAFTYSKDTKIATASSIKGPMALFAYKCIDDGIISWDTMKKYQSRHYQANSTGRIKNYSYGTAFSVQTLMDYMIRISDNQAYLMIKELVGAENFEQMMASLGSTRVIPQGSNWGYITAWEMATVWREIYYYSLSSDSGAELFDRFMHAQYNYIWRAIPQYEAAHKSGWSGKAFNDAGVVFADGHQYVLVVLMGRSGIDDQRSHYQFNAITRLLAELMVEYNTYLDGESDFSSSEESIITEQ